MRLTVANRTWAGAAGTVSGSGIENAPASLWLHLHRIPRGLGGPKAEAGELLMERARSSTLPASYFFKKVFKNVETVLCCRTRTGQDGDCGPQSNFGVTPLNNKINS